MSAAEKLRALEIPGEFWVDSSEDARGVFDLTETLPQIIAVVEAAEKVRANLDAADVDVLEVELAAALAALEAALTEEKGIVRDSKLIDRFAWNSRDGVTYDSERDTAGGNP
jgi:hypothetical protein